MHAPHTPVTLLYTACATDGFIVLGSSLIFGLFALGVSDEMSGSNPIVGRADCK